VIQQAALNAMNIVDVGQRGTMAAEGSKLTWAG